MKRAWQLASLVFLAFSLFVFYSSFEYKFFDRLGPGPGFFPTWLSGIAAALAVVLFVQVALERFELPPDSQLPIARDGAIRVATVMIGLLGVILLLNTLGFRITTLLFMIYLPVALGLRNWLAIGTLAVIASFGVFQLFYYGLKLPLPFGVFGI